MQPDLDAPPRSLRDAEVGGEQVGGAGGDDRERAPGAGELVDAPLHHAVAAPHEEEVGTVGDGLRRTRLGAFLLLGTSNQSGSVTPRSVEHAPELGEPAAERLAAVRDHRDLVMPAAYCSRRRSAAAQTARTVTTAIPTHAQPIA